MKSYWPLPVFFLILLAILSVSQYADHSKREYEKTHTEVNTAPIAEDKDTNPATTNKPYEPPVWAKYVTSPPEGLGVWAVVLTLFAIVWQSIETRKAAEAAAGQIEVQRESLRPRLAVGDLVKDTFTEALSGEWVTVCIKFSNSGMTAYNVIVDTWIEFISGLPPYQFTAEARFRQAAPMNIANGSGFFIPLHRKLTEDERHQMANFEGAICFRVKLSYLAFGKEVHTDEAFVLRPKEMETIAKYTSAT